MHLNRRTIGHGVGLRTQHYARALQGPLDVDWVEVISENFFGLGGRPRAILEHVRQHMPVVLHGVSLGIAGVERPDAHYLKQLSQLAAWVQPAWISDHLCWARFGGHHSHDLLPLPYSEEALELLVRNVAIVQDTLKAPITLENVSSYVSYNASEFYEWEFLAELCKRTDTFILLDLNNIVVSAKNHGFAVEDYLRGIPPQRVRQLHLANHTDLGHYKFDSHAGAVPQEVWDLYRKALTCFGPVATCVEWDEGVPQWEVLRAEQQKALHIEQDYLTDQSVINTLLEPLAISARPRDPAPQVSLTRSQEVFWQALTAPSGVSQFLSHADAATARDFEQIFAETPEFDRIARVDVYANAYFFRLHGVLLDCFPVLFRCLGADSFHNLVTDYLLKYPSTLGDVRRIADLLPQFLRTWAHTDAVSLSQLAGVELAIVNALDCADEAVVMRQQLAAVPHARWPDVRLRFHPSVSLHQIDLDFSALKRDAQDASTASRGMRAAATKQCVMVWRKGLTVLYRTLELAERAALVSALQGQTFAELCTAAATSDEAFSAEQAAKMLSGWLDDELIVALVA